MNLVYVKLIQWKCRGMLKCINGYSTQEKEKIIHIIHIQSSGKILLSTVITSKNTVIVMMSQNG